MLHQINIYVQDMIARDRLPAQFKNIIPADVAYAASDVYAKWD